MHLDKCPGVRPIGIGEVPRRRIAKAILALLQPDIVDASGPLQVCAGQECGCEAAIHAMRQAFRADEIEGALLVDATNAINRQTALHNISVICPPLAQVLHNTYQASVRCVIPGSGGVSSSEGTTQGDPLAMAMYALAVRPLIDHLYNPAPLLLNRYGMLMTLLEQPPATSFVLGGITSLNMERALDTIPTQQKHTSL